MEIWKRHEKFDDYEVSTEGRVRNANTGRVLKTNFDKRGYEQLSLRKNNKRHTQRVRSLVADTFIEGEHTGMDIRNIDGDRSNSRANNLEYCTRSETIRRGVDRGNVKPPKMTSVRVVETGEIYKSTIECAKALGLDRATICKCINGVAYSCGGLHFERIE